MHVPLIAIKQLQIGHPYKRPTIRLVLFLPIWILLVLNHVPIQPFSKSACNVYMYITCHNLRKREHIEIDLLERNALSERNNLNLYDFEQTLIKKLPFRLRTVLVGVFL